MIDPMLARASWGLAFVPGVLLALFGGWRSRRAWRRFSDVPTRGSVSGARAARVLLDRNGMANVELYEGHAGGEHYDPRRRCVFLSSFVATSPSVAAVATVARVVAHARQYRQEQRLFRLRMATLRATGLVTHVALALVVVGLFDRHPRAGFLGIAGAGLYGALILLHLVTLRVEYESGRIARTELLRNGLIEEAESDAFRRMLGAAAWAEMPYLVAVVLGVGRLFNRPSNPRSRD